MEDRLCAWEYALSSEAAATRQCCGRCGGCKLTSLPVPTESGRSVAIWCEDCRGLTEPTVRVEEYEELPWNLEGVPRVPHESGETLRGAITWEDFVFYLGKLPNNKAPGPDSIPYELWKHAPDPLKRAVLACVNGVLSESKIPPRSWLGGLIRFLFKKGDLLDIGNYRPVCLQDTIYKILSAILTDRLYRLSERYGLLDPSQEGFRCLHSTQRQVQSLHWAFARAKASKAKLYVAYLDFANAFNSVDHEAVWRWLKFLHVPDTDLLRSLYDGAHYSGDLPYGSTASVFLLRGTKQGDKLSPLLFGLIFNVLLLALKASGVGGITCTGLRTPARGFADDLALTTESEGGMSRLLTVVDEFCNWSGMRIKSSKSFISAYNFKTKKELPTSSILYRGEPLTAIAARESFTYLGVRASLLGSLDEEKAHVFQVTKELVGVARHHQYLISQMVPAMHMVATARFRYSAPLVPWTDAELDKLHKVWLQVHRAAWTLPPSFAGAPLTLPSVMGGCPVAHPRVMLVQALAKHVEQLVALPDEIREATVVAYRKLCTDCGCHNERELAEHLAAESKPRQCPIARLLRACGQLGTQIRLPACLTLGKAARETSWHALLKHLRQKHQVDPSDNEDPSVWPFAAGL